MNPELKEILEVLPRETLEYGCCKGEPNAWVFVDNFGRLSILLKDGGWLGVEPEDFEHHLVADMAPFAG